MQEEKSPTKKPEPPSLSHFGSNLAHYFGNKVGMARVYHMSGEGSTANFGKFKADFTDGLEGIIARNNPGELMGVTLDNLREMLLLAANSDWSDVNAIKSLYLKYSEITGKNYNIPELFKEG
ncbi:hypothetical protein HYT58_01850 [Candidatus Woesearchaeota archaeon]|nr:hypothetical protein [Candidatus Woesearchaeota archaeon]